MSRWAVFVSGEGSNLQNVLELEQGRLRHERITAVFADRECRGIERARAFNKPTLILSPKVSGWTKSVLDFLSEHQVAAIFLLGYMRILPRDFLQSWKGRIVNLHPSWLPLYPGLESVKRAFEAGEKCFGVSLHEVVEEVDAGPILRQLSFPRPVGASFDGIMSEVHRYERRLVSDYLLDLDEAENDSA